MPFAEATAIESGGPDRWLAPIRDGWDIGGNANGGYLLSLGARAMAAAAQRPDPVSITAHHLRPGAPGEATVTTRVVKTGRRFTTVSATMSEPDDRPLLQVLGAFSDLSDSNLSGADLMRVEADPPDLPPPDVCHRMEGGDGFPPPLMSRIDLRLHPDDALFTTGPSGNPLVRGWLRCEFSTRFVTGGFLEEDGSVWDGAYLATTRPDGHPHVAWVGIGFDDLAEKMWTATYASSQKAANLRHDRRTALHWPERPDRLVFMRAVGRLIDDPAERSRLWERRVLPYDQEQFFRTADDPELLFVELTPIVVSIHRGDPGRPPERWRPAG